VIWTDITGFFLQILFGGFSGMFIGCLALAIAEMLDSIPIFTRRVGLRQGIGLAILSMSVGKLCGALFYFYRQLYQVVQ
jgi:stage V sporulation protein AB